MTDEVAYQAQLYFGGGVGGGGGAGNRRGGDRAELCASRQSMSQGSGKQVFANGAQTSQSLPALAAG